MIRVIKRFKRLSENLKEYKVDEVVSFNKKTEDQLIADGLAVRVTKKDLEKKEGAPTRSKKIK